MFLVIAPRLLLFVQPPNGLINLGDTTYHVLDELLAPVSGGLPYGSYMPQYTGILGWLFVPIRLFDIEPRTFMALVVAACNLLNLAVPLLVVGITKSVLPKANKTLVFFAFVSLWTVCGSDLGYSTQVREFSHFARLVPSLFALWLLLRSTRGFVFDRLQRHGYLAGLGLSLAILNSADHGFTLAISIMVMLVILTHGDQLFRPFAIQLVIGTSASLLAYLAALSVAGQPFSAKSYIGIRSQAISGGIYESDMRVAAVGPQLLILVLPVLLAALVLLRTKQHQQTPDESVLNVLCLTLAVWSPALLVKFILKDPQSGVEVPSFFALAFISCAVVLAKVDLILIHNFSIRLQIQALPLLFLPALALGSLYPDTKVNVADEVWRIAGQYINQDHWSSPPDRSTEGWTPESLASEDNFLVEVDELSKRAEAKGKSVGYFGVFGNTVELITGVNNLTGIAAPESLRFGARQNDFACKPILTLNPDLIIVYEASFQCPRYSMEDDLSGGTFRVFKRDP